MIVRQNKGFETNSQYPNTDWYDEGNYTVDETTPEGKILAEKIIRLYPNYDLMVENNQLVDVIGFEPGPVAPQPPTQEDRLRAVEDALLEML